MRQTNVCGKSAGLLYKIDHKKLITHAQQWQLRGRKMSLFISAEVIHK